MQRAAWNAPETPESLEPFVSATKALFDAGFADPRNCDYREIQLRVGDGKTVKTHGWLIPRQPKDSQYAITWNGLVYPIETVGEKADLKADALALFKADEEVRAKHVRNKGANHPFFRYSPDTEAQLVSHQVLQATTASMLLRLGETELAGKIWEAWRPNPEARRFRSGHDFQLHDDWFVLIAEEYLWSLMYRAVCTHMYGADALSLASSQQCRAAKVKIDELAAARGYKEPDDDYWKPFRFMASLDTLIADTQRRLAHPPDPKTEAGGTDLVGRITTLLDRLDQAFASQSRFYRGHPGNDPIVKQLIAVGMPAVEPLLECLEQDMRLTRGVRSFHRVDYDGNYKHLFVGVHEAAYAALAGILEQSFLEADHANLIDGGMEGRKKIATAVREYWNKYKNFAPEDRWFVTLADDDAPFSQWVQAAKLIASPPPEVLYSTQWWIAQPAPRPPLRGEPLRNKSNSSVTDLLAKRLQQGSIIKKNDYSDLRAAEEIAIALAAWDGKRRLKDLEAYTDAARLAIADADPKYHDRNYDLDFLRRAVATMTILRTQLGDDKAIEQYADWIRTVTPGPSANSIDIIFKPMYEYQSHAAIRKAADAIFTGNDSPWFPGNAENGHNVSGLWASPLLGLPAFRNMLLPVLDDKSLADGYLTWATHNPKGFTRTTTTRCWSRSFPTQFTPEEINAKPGTKFTFRTCDVMANELSAVKGFPRCELWWPEAKRDEAVAACKKRLKNDDEK